MADITPHSVIYSLPVMTFRGLEAPPYDVAGFGFSHSHGERQYPYIDGKLHDWTGLDAQALQFKLYFLNSLKPDAFPYDWNGWWAELRNGEPGEMVHPLLGPVQVVVRGGDVQLTAKVTSGIIVDVNFETTIRDPEEQLPAHVIASTVSELVATTVAEASAAGVELPSEESAVDITQIGDQLSGFAYGLEMTALGLIGKAQAIAGDFVTASELAGHTAYKARDAAIALWASLEDLGARIGVKQARDTGAVLTTRDMTLDAFARERGNTVAEVAGLNPAALASPTVSKGTMLKYYK